MMNINPTNFRIYNMLGRAACLVLTYLLVSASTATADSIPTIESRPIPGCFGVNVHFADMISADDARQLIPEHVKLLRQAGFGWVRIDLRWGEVEQDRGEYDFEKYDITIKALNEAGIHVLAILDDTNSLYDNDMLPRTDEGREAFNAFAAAAAERYKNADLVWEIYNEPNTGDWEPEESLPLYIQLASKVTETLRRVSPERPVVGPALSGPVSDGGVEADKPLFAGFLAGVLDSNVARSWSAITLHPYRTDINLPPETASRDFAKVRKLMRKHGYAPEETPPLAGEWGYSTAINNIDEWTQAAYLTRSLLWATTESMPFSIWYNWQERGTDANDDEHKYGLLRFGKPGADDDLKKPAFEALQILSGLLNGYSFDKLLRKDDWVMIVRFAKNGRKAFALWSTDNKKHKAEILLPKGNWDVISLMDEPKRMASDGAKPEQLNINLMPLILLPR